MFKKFFSHVLAMVVSVAVLSLTTVSVFASETECTNSDTNIASEAITLEVTSEGIISATNSDGGIMPLSSISGYDQRTLTKEKDGLQVVTNGFGIGGMGVTIKASSNWSGYMSVSMYGSNGEISFERQAVFSNGSTEFHDLKTYNPDYYILGFLGIPDGVSVFVQVWIYG